MFGISNIYLDRELEAIGVDKFPLISWKLESDGNNINQRKFRIELSFDSEFDEIVFDSGVISSSDNHYINENYTLKDFTRYYLNLTVTNNEEEKCNFKTTFSTGYVNTIISAQMVGVDTLEKADVSDASYLRKKFKVCKPIKEAYLTATAFGLYQSFLNGKRIGSKELTPGWTEYKKNLLYQVYDVTQILNQGFNTLGVILGSGWYKGDIGYVRRRNVYGNQTGFLGELHIRYCDGEEEVIKSDETFKVHESPIEFSEFYDGEIYNEEKDIEDWNLNNFDDSDWKTSHTLPLDYSILSHQLSNSVEIIEQKEPYKMFVTPNGDTVVDFGQNLSGWVRINAEGEKGDVIELNFFEVLGDDGNPFFKNLRSAKQTLIYKFDRDHKIEYLPHFTCFGFRYMKISKFCCIPTLQNFTLCVLHTKFEKTGDIQTSDKLLNKLNSNILWGLKSNFVDIPLDCPQRDERLGWTGDAQIFSRTASFFVNTYQFYNKWLKDLTYSQKKDGGVPFIVPDVLSTETERKDSSAAWGDAAVIIPWNMYLCYGDTTILVQQYESMKKWIDFMINHSVDYIWNYKLQFGDWVALDAEEGSNFGATPTDLTCAAYCAYSTGLFVKIAKILNRMDDAVFYSEYQKKVIGKYQEMFFDKNHHMTVKTQTAHVISLCFGLVEEEYKKIIVDDLVELIKKENGHLVTGFIGTPFILQALSDNGKLDWAYNLLLRKEYPSWLYQVTMGATTIWEHWDSLQPNGKILPVKMNSFNHYSYGAIGEWMQKRMVGIDIDENNPGYKHFFIQPLITNKIDMACGKYNSSYGLIESRWENLEDSKVKLSVTIPVNTTCTIRLMDCYKIIDDYGMNFSKTQIGFESTVGSGKYRIIFEKNKSN